MENQVKEEVGYLESEAGRKSGSRLNMIICAGICVFAALVEGGGEIITSVKGSEINQADWQAIAILVGALLIGNGVVKGASAAKQALSNSKK